jgi:nucleoside-diphosphate-sugar epimerase
MNILITGGCGYVGTKLTLKLLDDGHKITVFDTQWFGNYLPNHKNLTNIKGNITDTESIPVKGNQVVIHLANIANDPAVDLNPTLSWEVNVLASQQLAEKCVRSGVKQLIYASSGSVYGIKSEEKVTEDLSLVPISAYNKTKMVAERVFLSYKDKIQIHCIRPATVCGLSPRMRLDVSVNMLTFQAVMNKKITVFGGNQTRPNIHIDDMVNVYDHFILNSDLESGCYNAGFENITILDIAKKISSVNDCEIIVTESNDPRSYRQDSQKLINTGFNPNFGVFDAITQISESLSNGKLIDNENWYTIKTMKKIKF